MLREKSFADDRTRMSDADDLTFVPSRLGSNTAELSLLPTLYTSGSATQVKWNDAAVIKIFRGGITATWRDIPWERIVTTQGLTLWDERMNQGPMWMQCFLHVPKLLCGWRNLRPLRNLPPAKDCVLGTVGSWWLRTCSLSLNVDCSYWLLTQAQNGMQSTLSFFFLFFSALLAYFRRSYNQPLLLQNNSTLRSMEFPQHSVRI